MIAAHPVFWGLLITMTSLVALALLIARALMSGPGAGAAPPPSPGEERFAYTCHCWQDPVRVTVRREPPPRRRHARPGPGASLRHRFRRRPPVRSAPDRGEVSAVQEGAGKTSGNPVTSAGAHPSGL